MFRLDGIKVQLEKGDLDGDGVVGGVETVRQSLDKGILMSQEQTELGQAFSMLDKDEVTDSRFSSIDFNARINPLEAGPMVAVDSLIALGFLSVSHGLIVRSRLRKSVSELGKGRAEKVQIAIGKRDHDGGMMQGMKNFVGAGKNG